MPMTEFAADDGVAIQEPVSLAEQFAVLPLDLIVPSRTNPRTTFDPVKLLDLAESIRASGVHQPILVRRLPADRLDDTFRSREPDKPLPEFEIVTGERRYRASKAMAGVDTIPAMIRVLSDTQVLEIQIVENLQRADLTELEEAEGYQRLCDTTGIAKEAVGERIGKSRSYVYGRMKLLDLTPAPREALRNGDIDASKALLIARIPDDKQQLRALEAAREKDHQGSPRLSYRALQSWVQQNVMLKLATAKFSIVDANLVPAAGPCPACPKRTGANPDLFSDVEGPDLCIDPACFHLKEEAHSASLVAVARAKGVEVIEGREAKEVMPHAYAALKGYTSLDVQHHSGKSLRDLLTPKELKKAALLVTPESGKLIDVIPDEVAAPVWARLRKEKATPAERKRDAHQEEKRNRERLELDYHKRWRAAAIAAIAPRVKAGEIRSMSAGILRVLLLEICGADQRCSEGDANDALGLEKADDELVCSTVRALDDNDVGYAVLLTLLQGDSTPRSSWNGNDERVINGHAPIIEDLAAQLGISLDEIRATVQSEIRAEAVERDAPKKLPAGSGKKIASPTAHAKHGKPSAEEVQGQIAEALQALEKNDQAPSGAELEKVATGVAEGTDQAPTGAMQEEEAAGAAMVASSPSQTSATSPAPLLAGDRVTFKNGLKDLKGRATKYSGKEGTVLTTWADGLVEVRYGSRPNETVSVPVDELEPPPAAAPVASWPFPKEARP